MNRQGMRTAALSSAAPILFFSLISILPVLCLGVPKHQPVSISFNSGTFGIVAHSTAEVR